MMFFALVMTILLLTTVESRFIRASSKLGDTNFYDEYGRVRIFHGGNRVMKGFPWYVFFFRILLEYSHENTPKQVLYGHALQ